MTSSALRRVEPEAPTAALRVIIAALLAHQLRDLESRIPGGSIPRAARWGGVLVALATSTLLTAQCWMLGDDLYRSGITFSTISVLVAVGASLAALALLARAGQSSSAVYWAKQVLAPLPLTTGQVGALAHLVWVWPVVVIAAVVLVPVAAFVLGIRALPADLAAPVAIGALVVVAPVVLAQLIIRWAGTRRSEAVILPAGLTGALLAYGHAGWFVAAVDREVADLHERSPVVGLLVSTGSTSWVEAVAWASALLAAATASRLATRGQRRGGRSTGSLAAPSPPTSPLRLATAILLLTRKPSSIRAESVTMVLAVVVGSWVATLLYANGRVAHGQVIVTWLGFVAAIPLLSLRSGSGPTQRFVSLGVRPVDLALALTAVGLLLLTPTLLVGVAALSVAGVGAEELARLVLSGLLGAFVAMTLSHLAREVTRLSLGRIGVSWLLLAAFAGLSALGATRWSLAPLRVACAIALGSLVIALWCTVRVTTLDTTAEDS